MGTLSQKDAVDLITKKETINDPYHRDYVIGPASAVRVNDIGELYDRQTTVAFITMTACLTAIMAAIVIGGRK